jgi:dihydrofolate reductase
MGIKASVYIATSLDGYIARNEGATDWLVNKEYEIGDDYGYEKFFGSVDSFIVGRNTFELSLKFTEWPYADKKVFVLTTRNLILPGSFKEKVERVSGTPGEVILKLSNEGFKHVYIDGGKTIQSFLSAGLINEMTITTIPVLIGEGKPLFGKLDKDLKLRHLETTFYKNGFVKNYYKVIPN